jgi:hypothetical protein
MVSDRYNISLRLGSKRRNWRDYPLKLQRFGLTSWDRMKIIRIKQQIPFISFAIRSNRSRDDSEKDRSLRRMLFFLLYKLRKLTRPNLPYPKRAKRRNIRLDSFSDEYTFQQTGFSLADNILIFELLDLPDHFEINACQGARHSLQVNSEHAYVYSMMRMHQPWRSFWSDQKHWGYDYSTLSKV